MGYTLKPGGVQNPSAYNRTGSNYARYGEQPGYTYDPVNDLYYTPEKWNIIQAQRKQQQDAANAINNPKKPAGLGSTLGLVAGVAGAGTLAKEGAQGLFNIGSSTAPSAITQTTAEQIAGQGASNVAANTGAAAANTGSSVASATGVTPVGTAANGGTLMSDGTIQAADAGSSWTAAPGTAGQVLGAAAAIKGGYDTINALQNGGKGLRTGLAETGGGIGSMVAGPVGGAIGAIGGNILGYGLKDNGWKNHLALAAVAPPLELLRLAGFNPIHETTRQNAQKHTAGLLGIGKDDKQWQDYVKGMRAQYNEAPKDPTKAFAGQYATWDEYKKAGLKADDLTGVYGNLDTFGPEWAKLTFDQQKAVTQGIINAGLYDSKKGEVLITDKEAAKKIKDSVIGSPKTAAPTPLKPADSQPQAAPQPTVGRPQQIVNKQPQQQPSNQPEAKKRVTGLLKVGS